MKKALYAVIATVFMFLGLGAVQASDVVPLKVEAKFDGASVQTFEPTGYDYGDNGAGGYYKESLNIPVTKGEFLNLNVTLGNENIASPEISKFEVTIQTGNIVSSYKLTPILVKNQNGIYTASFKLPTDKILQKRDSYDGITISFTRSNGTERIFRIATGEATGSDFDYSRFAGTYTNQDSEDLIINADGSVNYKEEVATNNPMMVVFIYDENLKLIKEELHMGSYSNNYYLEVTDENTLSVLTKSEGTLTGEVFNKVIHVTDFTLNQDVFNLEKGQTGKINITGIFPNNATITEATYSSDDATIASVSNDGTITALKTGSTYINVEIDGIVKKVLVIVKVPTSNNVDSELEDDIKGSIKDDNQPQVDVNINKDNNHVSDGVFDTLMGTDKVLVFNKQENGKVVYSWAFKGNNVTNASDLDLDIKISKTNNKLNSLIENMIEVGNPLFFEFAYHGLLPGIANMMIYVGDVYKDGTILYLYYYNEETNKPEFLKEVTVQNGMINFDITHCSTYFTTTNILKEKEITKIENPSTNSDNPIVYITTLIIGLFGIGFGLRKLI